LVDQINQSPNKPASLVLHLKKCRFIMLNVVSIEVEFFGIALFFLFVFFCSSTASELIANQLVQFPYKFRYFMLLFTFDLCLVYFVFATNKSCTWSTIELTGK